MELITYGCGANGRDKNGESDVTDENRGINHNVMWLILGVIVCALIYLLRPILAPFLIAALLAYMGGPIVLLLQRWHVPRALGAILVIMGFILLLVLFVLLLIPLLVHEIQTFASYMPTLLDWLQQHLLPLLNKKFGEDINIDLTTVKEVISQNWQHTGKLVGTLWKALSQSGLILFEFILNLVLVPVVTFYLLRDWHRVIAGGRSLLPRQVEPIVVDLVGDCNEVLGAFLRGAIVSDVGVRYFVCHRIAYRGH